MTGITVDIQCKLTETNRHYNTYYYYMHTLHKHVKFICMQCVNCVTLPQ